MKRSTQQTLAMTGLALLVVILIAGIFLGLRYLASWNIPGNGLSGVYGFTGRVSNAFAGAVRGFQGTDELMNNRSENMRLRTQIAELQDISEENVFLRKIADIPARREYRAVASGIFAYAISGQQIQVTVNVGSSDDVVPGSAVVTKSGALLGFVRDVRERSALVTVLGDSQLQVTGRVAGEQTGGLVRTDGNGRLILDLIGKDELVREGDVIITSGLDHAPPGLIVGIVRSVDPESTTLFQQIRVDVAHEAESVWRVIVLIP